jgi:hypothetical protein
MSSLQGLVVHITDGDRKHKKAPTLNGVWGHFNNPRTRASAHFCISEDGEIWQFIDTANRAWAIDGSVNDSHWISVENIALPGAMLTEGQLDGVAVLLAWLRDIAGVPLQLADTKGGSGLGYHQMFKIGDHACPGPNVVAQRDDILDRARNMDLGGASLGEPTFE